MSGIAVKNGREPDDRRSLGGKGEGQVVQLDGRDVLFQPGWRWSEDVKPIAWHRPVRDDPRDVLHLGSAQRPARRRERSRARAPVTSQ